MSQFIEQLRLRVARLYLHCGISSEREFYIGSFTLLSQFIEPVTFARCAFIFALRNITLGGYLDTHYYWASGSEATLVCSICLIFAIFIYCERSELSGLFNGTDFLYIFQAGRTSCRKCSKCFYLYLNIRSMRYSAMQL